MTRRRKSTPQGRFGRDLPVPPLPEGPYDIIVADPPWSYGFGFAGTGGAQYQYPTMTQKALFALGDDVWNVSHSDTYLCLWSTSPKLPEALALMDAWQYQFVTTLFTWVKTNADGSVYSGLGFHTNQNPEFVLLGKRRTYDERGRVAYLARRERLARNVKAVIMAPKGRHSEKPAEMYRRLIRLYEAERRIDLFGRAGRPGFDTWGLNAAEAPPDDGGQLRLAV